jgi:hypothetical protein
MLCTHLKPMYVFFFGVDEDKFVKLAPEFFTTIESRNLAWGYIWGELQPPARNDSSKHMDLGKWGVMISGWRSREEHDSTERERRRGSVHSSRSSSREPFNWFKFMPTLLPDGSLSHHKRGRPGVQVQTR